MVEVMATPTGKGWADYLAAELDFGMVEQLDLILVAVTVATKAFQAEA